MEHPYKALTTYAALWATNRAVDLAADHLNRAHAFNGDTERKQRLIESCCKSCWYFMRPRIGGAAMTTWYCGMCAKRALDGSTATDRVCLACAKEHRLCTQCGGDLDMRVKRRKWPTSKQPPAPTAPPGPPAPPRPPYPRDVG